MEKRDEILNRMAEIVCKYGMIDHIAVRIYGKWCIINEPQYRALQIIAVSKAANDEEFKEFCDNVKVYNRPGKLKDNSIDFGNHVKHVHLLKWNKDGKTYSEDQKEDLTDNGFVSRCGYLNLDRLRIIKRRNNENN